MGGPWLEGEGEGAPGDMTLAGAEVWGSTLPARVLGEAARPMVLIGGNGLPTATLGATKDPGAGF